MSNSLFLIIVLLLVACRDPGQETRKQIVARQTPTQTIEKPMTRKDAALADYRIQMKKMEKTDSIDIESSMQLQELPEELFNHQEIKYLRAGCITKDCFVRLSSSIAKLKNLEVLIFSKTDI